MDGTAEDQVAGPEMVVRRPGDVSATWLDAVLAGRGLLPGGARVASVRVEPVGTGQMADTVRLRPVYEPDGAGPATLVAKFASADAQSHATGKALRAYEIEVRFYGLVARRVRARVPSLVAAALDPDEAWFTLVLEDVGDAVQGDQILGCSPDVAAAAVAEMAGLHAPCWEVAELAGMSWLNRSSPASDETTAELVAGVYPGFRERYGDRLAPEHVAVLDRFIGRLRPWMAARGGPRTVVHGDFRLDNLLFVPGDPAPVVVDFQTAVWGAGAYDLAYFVGGCLDPDVRRAHEDGLVSEYHGRLRAGGVVDYPLEALVTDYRRECLGGLVMAVGASMLVKRTERGDAMFVTSAARHAQHGIDQGALSLLDGVP